MAKKKRGRPKNEIMTRVRQVGRWPDEQWDRIRTGAELAGLDVANFARAHLIPAAETEIKRHERRMRRKKART